MFQNLKIKPGRRLVSSASFVWLILFALILVSALSSPVFLSGRNLKNVFLIQPVGLGIAALAQA